MPSHFADAAILGKIGTKDWPIRDAPRQPTESYQASEMSRLGLFYRITKKKARRHDDRIEATMETTRAVINDLCERRAALRDERPTDAIFQTWDGYYTRSPITVPDVWDRPEETVNTGILTADGTPVMRKKRAMDPIGFVWFGDK